MSRAYQVNTHSIATQPWGRKKNNLQIWNSRSAQGFTTSEVSLATWKIAAVAPTYPQPAYAGMQNVLQSEWTFVQRVIQGISEKFSGIRDAMHTAFLPSLLREKISNDGPVWRLVCLPMKTADLSLSDPMVNAHTHLHANEVTNSHLIQVMRWSAVFSLADHRSTTQQEKKSERAKR
jgi:hypothetical protein